MKRPNLRPIKARILAIQIMEKVEKPKEPSLLVTLEQVAQETAGERPTNKLSILRVGRDVEEVQEGDIVIFNGRGTRIEHEDQKYLLIEEKDIFTIVE